jgi:PAS domain S-box-containing protein
MCLAAYAALGGIITLAGWFAHIPRLTDWLGAGISMFANPALAAAFSGIALLLGLLRPKWCRILSASLGLFVAFIGSATLFEHLSGINLGIDTLLVDKPWGLRASATPGRMGPPASISFTLLGLAILLIVRGRRSRKAAAALGVTVCAIATLALIGYAFGANPLFSATRFTGIAMQTATIVLALGLAVLARLPHAEPLRTFRSATSAGVLTRRALPFVIALPVILGWIGVRGRTAGWFDTGMETAMLVLALITVLAGMLWSCAAALARHEKSLHENQIRLASLAAIVEFSDDAIITKDLTGIITSWNNGAERIFGYKAAEIIGKPVSTLIPEDRQNEEPGILDRISRGIRIDHYETIRRRKDGTFLHISLTVSPVRDANGRIIGASKIARDISELRKVRDALAASREDLEQRVAERTASLQQAIAQMEEFSYSVSHDLRAPVRAMKGYAQAILDDYGQRLDNKGRDYLDRILRASSRMEQLIHDVLTYSRLAASRIETRPVSLHHLLTDVIQQYPEMQTPHAQITIKEPLHDIVAHEPSLTQAVSNLLSNGVKFVIPGTLPKLQVWTEQRNGSVRLWVQDNGIGINPKYQGRLFGMFERVHQSRDYEGTGIGLAIVRKAAEKMGGSVGVQSDGVTGSSFWIELPAAPSLK